MKTFREFLNERKQVGTLYHFTKVEFLNHLLSNDNQAAYGMEVLEFFAHNDRFSCTRDGCMAHNVLSKDINVSKGYTVRIDLNGDKISDKYKITPINGFDNNGTDGRRVGKEQGEKEEVIDMKMNYKAEGKTFKALKYIEKITFHNDIKSNPDFNMEETTSILDSLGIPYEFVRKYNTFKKLDERSNLNVQSHNYCIELV